MRVRDAGADDLEMRGAIALYRSLGFVEVEPYCDNPVVGAVFFARRLN